MTAQVKSRVRSLPRGMLLLLVVGGRDRGGYTDEGGEAYLPEVEFASPDDFFSGVDAAEKREWLEEALCKLPEHQRSGARRIGNAKC